MFTGIIKTKGKIEKISKTGVQPLFKVSISAPKNWSFKKGESVSVSGICSTLVNSKKNVFDVEYMKETLSKTTVSEWQKGRIVNLEKSLKVGDPLDGHFVYGHVDAKSVVKQVTGDNSQLTLRIYLENKFSKYVVYKGSVAIDGVSLTVSKRGKDFFEVSLIPYTAEHTTLGNLKKNDNVNVETDILAKYASNLKLDYKLRR